MRACPTCHGPQPFEMELWLTDRYVRFNSCRPCARSWWSEGPGDVPLSVDDLMSLVAAPAGEVIAA